MFVVHKKVNFLSKRLKTEIQNRKARKTLQCHFFHHRYGFPHMDVKTRSRGVKTRQPFRLRSNCLQLRSITFDLRNFYHNKYVKKSKFFRTHLWWKKWHWRVFLAFLFWNSVLNLFDRKLTFLWITNILFSRVPSYTEQFWRGCPNI